MCEGVLPCLYSVGLFASDLDARAALYADADPGNDPPLSVPNRSCVYCHAQLPESQAH